LLKRLLANKQIWVLEHWLNSSDLAPCDNLYFRNYKSSLKCLFLNHLYSEKFKNSSQRTFREWFQATFPCIGEVLECMYNIQKWELIYQTL
jgi:hypothetical protein